MISTPFFHFVFDHIAIIKHHRVTSVQSYIPVRNLRIVKLKHYTVLDIIKSCREYLSTLSTSPEKEDLKLFRTST